MEHVYVHVPFCSRRCSYCDFAIAVRKRVPTRAYVEAVLAELALLDRADLRAVPRTVYFGGGTPSHLAPEGIESLLRAMPGAHGPEIEVTLEANPEDVTKESAEAWRRLGVNRISLGAQSFDDRALAWMHRVHDVAQTGAAVAALRGAGFANLSLDLIFGLPDELARDWRRDLEQALALEPTHLSLYGLTVEARTPLARWVSRGATRPPDDERYAEEYLLAHDLLGRAGFEFYEVSNAARGPYRSQHNGAYWSGRAYVGLGPAAHSFDGVERRWNLSAWEAYRRALEKGALPVADREQLSDSARELERRYLALRTAEGLSADQVSPERLKRWREAGWVTVQDGRARCTAEGWLRLDSLVADLTEPPGPA